MFLIKINKINFFIFLNLQLTLQNVSTAMKDVSERSKKINSKFNNLIDSNFLPKIKKLPE